MGTQQLPRMVVRQVVLITSVLIIAGGSVTAVRRAVAKEEAKVQQNESQESQNDLPTKLTPREKRLAEDKKKAPIVPVVAIRPGESRELLLSTWCTVGVTRGGGLGVKEMVDGKPQYNEKERTFSRDGLTISVPGFKEATATADLPIYKALREKGVAVFAVEVAAAADAKPGAYEMHVNDSTCSGNCKSDFRVVVIGE